MEFLLYLLSGAIAGLFSGMFGIGGGIILVPIVLTSILLYVVRIKMTWGLL